MSKYSNTSESELTGHIIDHYQTRAKESDYCDRLETVEPEAHYNHYGDRGAADLYLEMVDLVDGKEYHEGYLYEIKSGRAVEEANGAGEIIRQFNRMTRYFFEDASRTKPGRVHAELTFIPTPTTLEHLEKNQTLYQEIKSDEDEYSFYKTILFRAPEKDMRPGNPFFKDYDTVTEALAYTKPEYARYAGIDESVIEEVRPET